MITKFHKNQRRKAFWYFNQCTPYYQHQQTIKQAMLPLTGAITKQMWVFDRSFNHIIVQKWFELLIVWIVPFILSYLVDDVNYLTGVLIVVTVAKYIYNFSKITGYCRIYCGITCQNWCVSKDFLEGNFWLDWELLSSSEMTVSNSKQPLFLLNEK